MPPEIYVADGVRYVPESAFLELKQQFDTYESLLRSLADQLAELGIRPQNAAEGDQPTWQLTKIQGPGWSALPGAANVQIYRIAVQQEQQEEQEEGAVTGR
jgi:hypothetical protein